MIDRSQWWGMRIDWEEGRDKFFSDRNILYLDCGGVSICQSSLNDKFKMDTFNCMYVLYFFFTFKVTQSCPTLCDPMDCTVHGILQARILEWVAFPFSRGFFPTQGLNPGLPHCRQILYQLNHNESPRILGWVAYPFSRGSSQPRN